VAALAEGRKAPPFTLEDAAGARVSLADFKGRDVVVYFYPRDDTPGCTKEACSFRDFHGAFEERGAVVLGISPDGEQSHVMFKEKFSLPFALLADTDRKVAETYGVLQTGAKFVRSTFIIDAEGNVAKAMYGVDPDRHAEEVLAALA
jgi:peroxiredoxin Q/BCP